MKIICKVRLQYIIFNVRCNIILIYHIVSEMK